MRWIMQIIQWFCEKLLANLHQLHIIVIDNVLYHFTQLDKAPTQNDTKKVMQEWLQAKGIEFDPDNRKCELMEKIKANKPPVQ